jgi:hypothetical protein
MTYLVLAVHMNSRQLFPIELHGKYISAAYSAALRISTSNAQTYLYKPDGKNWYSYRHEPGRELINRWSFIHESEIPVELRAIALLHN